MHRRARREINIIINNNLHLLKRISPRNRMCSRILKVMIWKIALLQIKYSSNLIKIWGWFKAIKIQIGQNTNRFFTNLITDRHRKKY
jgi:hypothetical protein